MNKYKIGDENVNEKEKEILTGTERGSEVKRERIRWALELRKKTRRHARS